MFWIVLRDEPSTRVEFRHSSLASARAEAERLARVTGARFFVLQTLGEMTRPEPPVEWSTHYSSDIPSYETVMAEAAADHPAEADPLDSLPF